MFPVVSMQMLVLRALLMSSCRDVSGLHPTWWRHRAQHLARRMKLDTASPFVSNIQLYGCGWRRCDAACMRAELV